MIDMGDRVLEYVIDNYGVSVKEIMGGLDLNLGLGLGLGVKSKQSTVSARLTGLKHRGLINNGYGKWFYCTRLEELDDRMIEIELHNGNVEVWKVR